tara:strand:+ start:53065 stop:53355 length:291 start_codon:yes stop_codon:yes gene_type:complete
MGKTLYLTDAEIELLKDLNDNTVDMVIMGKSLEGMDVDATLFLENPSCHYSKRPCFGGAKIDSTVCVAGGNVYYAPLIWYIAVVNDLQHYHRPLSR